MQRLCWAALAATAQISLALPAYAKPEPGFKITLPEGFVMEAVGGPEFDVWPVRRGRREYLQIQRISAAAWNYSGKFPSDPSERVRIDGKRQIGFVVVAGHIIDREWLIQGRGGVLLVSTSPGVKTPGDRTVVREIALSIEPG